MIRLDPARDAAWRHLGYKKQGTRWIKPDQAAAEKQEAEKQKLADKYWKPVLAKFAMTCKARTRLGGRGPIKSSHK